LATAVVTDERDHFAVLYGEVEVADDGASPVANIEPEHREHRLRPNPARHSIPLGEHLELEHLDLVEAAELRHGVLYARQRRCESGGPDLVGGNAEDGAAPIGMFGVVGRDDGEITAIGSDEAEARDRLRRHRELTV